MRTEVRYFTKNGGTKKLAESIAKAVNAEAKTVATRTLPDGTEYLFTAADLPREDKPNMPPAGEMQVYVTVANGQTPVFTKVIR